ncbi:hypothetical protein GA0111570_103116 [Raineyella antarctica]|uniref:AAA+ ATPase domain-containing protein n=1 Tax=Raineyella antarctica TaxID=1577474 RepID=A0A1G6GFQ7_9ACTN|nr:helicase HerA-like domain-containing protein [Raineyella antarctica]SDB80794.1 hypothetical protein GA0111570_103116 [Raineyella antarctica]
MDLTPELAAIRDGYTFDVPTIQLGVAGDADGPHPEVGVRIPLGMLNRHGLVAGATGTGKTITLQTLAEQVSRAGVPVFAADVKGDLSGMASAGVSSPKLLERTQANGQQWQPSACPVEFYALGGEGTGIPLRTTISSFGPILLSKVLGLNDTQESSLGLVFHYADTNGLALLDIADLRAVLMHLDSEEGKSDLKGIGGISGATLGVVLRELTNFEAQGGDKFFGEPEFDTADLLRTTPEGLGMVSMVELAQLQDKPQLFSTFLMWLLADLYHDLPEVGDADRPKLVFFFDEAHLLFRDATKAFLESITQTVRLIRSKGVGVFFVTQTPKDVPDDVLAQLGSRVQHQLRAHTPNDAKALKATVSTYPTSHYDLEKTLTELGIGQAIVTVMDPDGAPTPVVWTRVWAPESKMGPTPPDQVQAAVAASPLQQKYGTAVDPRSAREILAERLEQGAATAAAETARTAEPAPAPTAQPAEPRGARERAPRSRAQEKSVVEQIVGSSAFKQFTRTAAREIARGVFGAARRR